MERTPNRRDFLKISGLVAAGLMLTGCTTEEVQNRAPQVTPVPTYTPVSTDIKTDPEAAPSNPLEAGKIVIGDAFGSVTDGFSEARSELAQVPNKLGLYVQTAGELTLLDLASSTMTTLIRVANPDYGIEWRRNALKSLNRHPLELLINNTIVAPFIEEGTDRFLPSYILDKFFGGKNEMHWGVGTISSILFALPHNFYDDEYGHTRFGLSIPLPHFAGGMYLWYLMRDRGFSFAYFAHSLHNLRSLIGYLNFRVSKENREY